MKLLLRLLCGFVEAHLLYVLPQLIKVLDSERIQILSDLLEFTIDDLISASLALAALEQELVLAVRDTLISSAISHEKVHVV